MSRLTVYTQETVHSARQFARSFTDIQPGLRAEEPPLPLLTMAVIAVCVVLQCFPDIHDSLYLEPAAVYSGEVWRLITGHLVHADTGHLFWNMFALGILGWMIESHSQQRLSLSLSLAAGIFMVDCLVMSPVCNLDIYCGLSGVLNSLLAVALWLKWHQSRNPLVPLLALLCSLKIVAEIFIGTSLLTDITWPPYPWAHLAGAMGGLGVLFISASGSRLTAS